MIAGRAILFETGLMFFINDDQTQLRRWCEDGTARTHHNLYRSTGDLLPVGMTLCVGQMTVQHGHGRKSTVKPADRLRRQADLGNQHDCLSSIADDFFNRLDIDFRLATACHAMQQQCPMLTRPDHVQDCFDSSPLIGNHHDLAVRFRSRHAGGCQHSFAQSNHQPLITQAVNGDNTTTSGLSQFINPHRSRSTNQSFNHSSLLGGKF